VDDLIHWLGTHEHIFNS